MISKRVCVEQSWRRAGGFATFTPSNCRTSGILTVPAFLMVLLCFLFAVAWRSEAAPIDITTQPSSRTNNFGTTAQFSVTAVGEEPLTYQWLKDENLLLVDGGNISGATNSGLNLSLVTGADRGKYSVIISNVSGSITSAPAYLTVIDPLITLQPTNAVRNPGESVTFTVGAIGSPELGYQWQKDGSELLGRTETNLVLNNVQASDIGYYRVVVSNLYGMATSSVAALTVNLTALDPDFQATLDGEVRTMVLDPEGRVLLGGTFSWLGGRYRWALARFNADGTLDTGFSPGAGGKVNCLAIQEDGKILVGGEFTSLYGRTAEFSFFDRSNRRHIGRLNTDGSVDTTFRAEASTNVHCVAIQRDGKIVVGGRFAMMNGQARSALARLNPDSTLDTSFNPNITPSPGATIFSLALQEDGKIIVAGDFSSVGGRNQPFLARLNPDGTADPDFSPAPHDEVHCIALQPDGKIVVTGLFDPNIDGESLVRVNRDGSLDTAFPASSFLPHWPASNVLSMAIQGNGSIILGGKFTGFRDQPRRSLARLHSDGTLDFSFAPEFSGQSVRALAVRPDGKILVGGGAVQQPCTNLVLLSTPEPSTELLTNDGSRIAWMYDGSSPAISRAIFDYSSNGVDWTSGEGTQIPGGWELTNVSVSAQAGIRARGFAAGGQYSASSGSIIGISAGPLSIIEQPLSQTLAYSNSSSLTVTAIGTPPLQYQWFKDGEALGESSNVAGASNSVLRLIGVSGALTGDYRVVVSNATESITSAVARLIVRDPMIVTQPVSVGATNFSNPKFSVIATGTYPQYLWYRDGEPVAGATNSTYTVSSVQESGSADYVVVVSNQFGAVTSSVVTVEPAIFCALDGPIYALGRQSDGKILAGGKFTSFYNQYNASKRIAGYYRTNISRINSDNTPDLWFNASANSNVNCLAIQEDGKIVLGGGFTKVNGQTSGSLARLNADGSVDLAFSSPAKGRVYCLALQANGKILAGGQFTALGAQNITNFGRFNPDGSIDPSFNANADGTVYAMTIQPDGQVLLGGDFATLCGGSRSRLGRVSATGELDPDFAPIVSAGSHVFTLGMQSDGKILVGGDFDAMGGLIRTNLGRLNADGTGDVTFESTAIALSINALTVSADDDILFSGSSIDEFFGPYVYFARLKRDGTLDRRLGNVSSDSVAVQADGNFLLGYHFLYGGGGVPGPFIACVEHSFSDTAAWQDLTTDSSSVTWTFGGSSPVPWRTTFDYSSNRTDWIRLGAGTRISGGWGFSGLSLPSNSVVRARGYVQGGQYNGSGWFMEAKTGAPWIEAQPLYYTNGFGSTANLSISVGGPEPVTYQWLKDGVPLTNGVNVAGAGTSNLVLNSLWCGNSGSYSVWVSNSWGVLVSPASQLVVLDPYFAVQPVGAEMNLGESITFSAAAIGSGSLVLQWYKDGLPLSGRTEPILSIPTIANSDFGSYYLVAQGSCGSSTSSLAVLKEPLHLEMTDAIYALALEENNQLLAGGTFTNFGPLGFNYLATLEDNGIPDTSFSPMVNGRSIFCVVRQPDGKLILGGSVSSVQGRAVTNLARLHADGTLDTEFVATAPAGGIYPRGLPCALLLQADGKILVGGGFSSLNGASRRYLGRLNQDGTLDTNFASVNLPDAIYSLALLTDGILVGGAGLVRLTTDGILDTSFNPEVSGISALAVQPDGKIIVGGNISGIGATPPYRMARLLMDGSFDLDFNPGVTNPVPFLALRTDGRILVGGDFTVLAGQNCTNLGQLNPDGTLDTNFVAEILGPVTSLAIEPDGSVLVAYRGGTNGYLRRVLNRDFCYQHLTCNSNTISWMRSGSGPEVSWTMFDASLDGENWLTLGNGTRVPGGWELAEISVPTNALLRARGYVPCGRYNGSGWFVENVVGPLAILEPYMARASGQMKFRYVGQEGQKIIVEASPDLQNWTGLRTNLYNASPVVFSEPVAEPPTNKFFRLRSED